MKKSDELEIAANSEQDDAKAEYAHYQAGRERNMEHFMEVLLPEIKQSPRVVTVDDRGVFFKISFTDGFEIDYYPKADRMFWCRQRKWSHNGYGMLEMMI